MTQGTVIGSAAASQKAEAILPSTTAGIAVAFAVGSKARVRFADWQRPGCLSNVLLHG